MGGNKIVGNRALSKKVSVIIFVGVFIGSSFFSLASNINGLWDTNFDLRSPNNQNIESPDDDTKVYLRLKGTTFDPLYGKPDIPKELVLTTPSQYYIVQFIGPICEEWKSCIRALGGKLFDYIPNYAFVMKMDDDTREKVGKLECVRAIVPFQPGYKIHPELLKSEKNNFSLFVSIFENLDEVETRIKSLGGEIISSSRNRIRLEVEKEKIKEIAFIPDVTWISETPVYKPANDIAVRIMNVNRSWSYPFNLHGENQIVAVADTGLDTGVDDHLIDGDIHLDFDNRVTFHSWRDSGSCKDTKGHGTHVAGSLCGDGTRSDGKIKGPAYKSDLVCQALKMKYGDFVIPDDLFGLFKEAYDDGARIHSNSWYDYGTYNHYREHAQDVDYFVRSYKDITILFCAGNKGPDNETIRSPATAKNCITVGGSENNKSEVVHSWYKWKTDDEDDLYFASSRGPVDDQRLKPDVIAPACYVLSTNSSQSGANLLWSWQYYDDYYTYRAGTSMATPLVAGAATLVRQFYVEKKNVSPSAALIKATLINGADDMRGDSNHDEYYIPDTPIPNYNEGWGRVNLSNSIYPPGRSLRFEDVHVGLRTGHHHFYNYLVSPGKPLKITLVWSDYEASPCTNLALINNLDLTVTSPNGTVYKGNAFSNGWSTTSSSQWDLSTPFNGYDDRNNVECIYIQDPVQGIYNVNISGKNIPNGPQDYALLVSGDIETHWPMFRHDACHWGKSPSMGVPITKKANLLWTYSTSIVDNVVSLTPGAVFSSPAVEDGVVYIGSDNNKIYALFQKCGMSMWSYETGGNVRSSPAVANGRVFVGSYDGYVYALDADPSDGVDEGFDDPDYVMYDLIWKYKTAGKIDSSPVVSDGMVFIGSNDHFVYALNETGSGDGNTTLIWKYETGGKVKSSPAVNGDKVFVASYDHYVYCLDKTPNDGVDNGVVTTEDGGAVNDTDNGTGGADLVWRYNTGWWVYSSPAVHDGRVFIGSLNGWIYALDEDNGEKIWSTLLFGGIYSSPAVAHGMVFIQNEFPGWPGLIFSRVSALKESDGSFVWDHTFRGRGGRSCPAIADGKVFVGICNDIVTLDEIGNGDGTTNVLGSYNTGKPVRSSPAVTDGMVFVGSAANKIYAFSAIKGNKPLGGEIIPGFGQTFELELTNDDDENQTIDLTIDWDTVPEEWSAILDKSNITLEPGESEVVNLTVESPPSAVNGSAVRVNFTSRNNSAKGSIFGVTKIKQEIIGDWHITGLEERTLQAIYLRGNLIVHPGGELTLDKTNLWVNCSSENQFGITVESGGSLDLVDDIYGSKISAVTPDGVHDYDFIVNGNMFMDNYNVSNTFNGLRIESSDVIITHSTFSNNDAAAIRVFNSNPIIRDCNVSNNYDGIVCDGSCTPIILDNIIESNSNCGITSTGNCNPSIDNNYISNNAVGVLLTMSSPQIVNNTITNSTNWDFHLGSNCHPTLLNDDFNETKVFFSTPTPDSSIIVQWYLAVYTLDGTNNTVSNASVIVRDFDYQEIYNGSTSEEGFVKWIVCTEYEELGTGEVFYHTPHYVYTAKNTYSNEVEVTMNETKTIGVNLPGPDLTLTSEDIKFDAILDGGETLINATIHNTGDMEATANVHFYYDTRDTPHLIGDDIVTVPSNSTSDATVLWNATGLLGDHAIIAIIDPDNEVLELEEGNNDDGRETSDWRITGDRLYSNIEVLLTGNLTIEKYLSFDNVTFEMNCLYDLEYRINVENNGEFKVNNSTIKGHNKNRYDIDIEPSANVEFYNSSLFFIEQGKNSGVIGPMYGDIDPDIEIKSDNVSITNCDIHGWGFAIHCNGSSPTITDTTIKYGVRGIYVTANSTASPIINNNTISNTTYGIYCKDSSPTIKDNTILNTTEYAIYGRECINTNITNNTIDNVNKMIFYDSTIDTLWLKDSNVTIVNGTLANYNLDPTSILTIQWYLHVNVTNTTGSPEPDAHVRVKDNENGTFDQTYYTGYRGYTQYIPCTEYILTSTTKTYYTPHNVTVMNYTSHGYTEMWMNQNREVLIMLEEDTPPISPTDLTISIWGSNITLNWTASPSLDLDHYLVFRTTDPNNFNFSNPYSNSTSWDDPIATTWNDTTALGDTNNSYYYIVRAVDESYNSDSNMGRVGKFVRFLENGWQLLSIPLIQSDNRITEVLETIEWDIARWYDPLDIVDHWKCYGEFKSSGLNDLHEFDHKMALWVNVTMESNLTVVGVVPESTTIQLYKGWNFVGYPSLTNKTVGDALSDIWENVTQVEGFNDTNAPYYLEILSKDDVMVSGYGYWICVTKDCEWTVKN